MSREKQGLKEFTQDLRSQYFKYSKLYGEELVLYLKFFPKKRTTSDSVKLRLKIIQDRSESLETKFTTNQSCKPLLDPVIEKMKNQLDVLQKSYSKYLDYINELDTILARGCRRVDEIYKSNPLIVKIAQEEKQSLSIIYTPDACVGRLQSTPQLIFESCFLNKLLSDHDYDTAYKFSQEIKNNRQTAYGRFLIGAYRMDMSGVPLFSKDFSFMEY